MRGLPPGIRTGRGAASEEWRPREIELIADRALPAEALDGLDRVIAGSPVACR